MFSQEFIEKLKNAERLTVLTGAGVSAESGIATFRDPDGLWAQFNPQEMASVDGFMSNPELVWSWYQYRRETVFKAKPNAGHFAMAEIQDYFDPLTLITQNVDQLHQKAGSQDVLELHGNIIENHCLDCGESHDEEIDVEDKEVPVCNFCGGKIRPSVVWFGEMLPEDVLYQAGAASEDCDLFLTIGTSGEVYPAAGLPMIAQDNGAYVVEINPNETVYSNQADEKIMMSFSQAMPMIAEIVKKYRTKV